jgi:hypothetical protein
MTRRRTIFAQPGSVQVMERSIPVKAMPGHWKQRVKEANKLGADVSSDADAKAYLRERGYGDIR